MRNTNAQNADYLWYELAMGAVGEKLGALIDSSNTIVGVGVSPRPSGVVIEIWTSSIDFEASEPAGFAKRFNEMLPQQLYFKLVYYESELDLLNRIGLPFHEFNYRQSSKMRRPTTTCGPSTKAAVEWIGFIDLVIDRKGINPKRLSSSSLFGLGGGGGVRIGATGIIVKLSLEYLNAIDLEAIPRRCYAGDEAVVASLLS